MIGANGIAAQTQGRNIRHYSNYLQERARAYRDTKIDWVRAKEPRLEKLTVDKGLLRETEAVQNQLTALLKCDVCLPDSACSGMQVVDMCVQVMDHEPENEITITVFRLLVLDLLQLFQVLNQAMINILGKLRPALRAWHWLNIPAYLGHFFEMSKPDAERAMDIYRTFTRQTDFVVQYLSIARQYEHHTRVEVPKLKHAPVNLGRQLEEYLKDPDFEIHRRQYLAELEAKKLKGATGSSSKMFKTEPASKADTAKAFSTVNGSQQSSKPAEPAKGPDQDLIDFFDSIEQNQTTMAVQPQPQAQAPLPTGVNPWVNTGLQMQPQGQMQPNGFITQPTGFVNNGGLQQPNMTGFLQQQPPQQMQPNPPQQIQPNFTGAGFGGFSPQPSFQPTSLSPIQQNTPASFQTASPTGFQTLQTPQQTTNPFRQSMMMTGQMTGQTTSPTTTPFQAAPLQRQATNPFARASPPTAQPYTSPTSITGSTPFQTQPPIPQQQQPLPLQAMPTGTNPFAKNFGQPLAQQPQPQQPEQQPMATGAGLVPQPTGATNPFRQGAFVNHNTGMGWQNHQQPIGGGLDQLETVPVFPRPAQQTPWQ